MVPTHRTFCVLCRFWRPAGLFLLLAGCRCRWLANPSRLVVPYPPGGSSGHHCALIGQLISQELKQTVVIDNKPGANGNLGAEFVARAPADGCYLLLCDLGALAHLSSIYTKLGFHRFKALRGAAMLAYSPHMLVVHPTPSRPAISKELVELSEAGPELLPSPGGQCPHLMELARITGAKWVYIAHHKGGVQSVQDTVAGQSRC